MPDHTVPALAAIAELPLLLAQAARAGDDDGGKDDEGSSDNQVGIATKTRSKPKKPEPVQGSDAQ